ncbi:MAG: cyclic-di-AMP receptor [Acidimicrobiia bacterium]
MLLVLIVVQTADAHKLITALLEMDLRVTKIGATGGWLGVGNVALLLGIDESKYDQVADVVARTCETRLEHMSTAALVDPTLGYATTVEVEVGGAVMFGLPVERFARIPGETDTRPPTVGSNVEETTMTTHRDTRTRRETGMKLVVAVVKGEDADAVTGALLDADIRFTRINTTGGFLRRGNSTLLIGVPGSQVDEVIGLIRRACPTEVGASPVAKGLPMYSATVFVLDSALYERV